MDIVVEDGTGLPTANAYLSTDEADELMTVNIYAAWNTLTDDNVKEQLLMWATRLIEERVKWFGYKVYPTSGLSWPRNRVFDHRTGSNRGAFVNDNLVPAEVKLATAVMANFLLTNAADPEALDSSNNLKELKVDVITLQFDPNITKNKYPVEIRNIIGNLGIANFGRGGPKFITLY